MDEQLANLLSFIPPDERKNLDMNDPAKVLAFLRKKVADSQPVTSDEYTKKLASNTLELDSEGGLLVESTKEFVIKAFDRVSRGKVFINVTSHPIVEEPHETEVAEDKIKQGFRVPMSVGDLGEILDKKGKPAKVFDVIVNPGVIKRIRPSSENPAGTSDDMTLFTEVLFNYATKKLQVYLAPNFTCLRKCKYKGSYVKFQRVKGAKKPRISVIESFSASGSENNPQQSNTARKFTGSRNVLRPEWKLDLFFENGDVETFEGLNFDSEVTGLKITVELPLLTTGQVNRPLLENCDRGKQN